MTLEPPQPPTAPAPAVRPTPPTPPRIDKTPFAKNSAQDVADESPEAQARDAVAHGSGALTKRTVERDENETPPPNQTVTIIPPDAPLVSDTQSDYDRGQDVLREFREMDARENQSAYNPPAQTSTEQERPVVPKLNYHDDGHGAPFWIFTAIFVIVAAFVVAKKFLFTDKSALTKAQLFNDAQSKPKATANNLRKKEQGTRDKLKSPVPKNDDKGKHFEIRV